MNVKNAIIITLIISSITCFGQVKNIKTEIKAENVFDLSIIKIYPESFPNISVVFQAKNEFGKPLWSLDKSEIKVEENQQDCEIIQLLNISKNKPVNIGLVFDHSGSMVDNPAQMPIGLESLQEYYFSGHPLPKDYVMAIDYAKEGVVGFLDEAKVMHDSIAFVGFSTTVDKIIPLANDVADIKLFLEKVMPGGSTPFYDALIVGIKSLSKSSSKSVIVALTDGLDNQSKYSFQEVIDLANEKEISIYTIGLGNVDTGSLSQISQKTNGFYYHTNDPKKLKEIYLNIKEQIRSIYQVDYTSNDLKYLSKKRNIRFSFVNDTLKFGNNDAIYSLPEETITYLKKKENDRNRMMYGGIGVLLLGLGSFIVYKRKARSRKRNKQII